MNKNINLYHKSLVSRSKSKRNNQNMRTLGIAKEKQYHAREETRRERYKKAGDRMRERFRKSREFRGSRRRRRRR